MASFLTEISPSSSPTLDQQKSSNYPFTNETFLVVAGFFIFSIFIRVISENLYKNRRQFLKPKSHKKTIYLQCHKCRYFTSNSYLKCSLHPSIVLTEDAINCIDYSR
jgi:hypothetical protein